ncbi:uncharacterized protein [Centruroides vittatus]|uniref:uncharacterized protein n=1 Tax=Centruroides vittatus TaxID=120091 RepID=UPI00350F69D1
MDSKIIALLPSDGGKIFISESTFDKIRNEQLESMMESREDSRILKFPYPTEVVARVVNYLDTNDPQIKSLKNGFHLYHLSRNYEIKILSIKCQEYIVEQLSEKNVCLIHDFACKMNLIQIQYHCWKIFDSYWREIFEGEDFKSCGTTTIDRLVSRPLYTSMSEVDIFLAVYKWIEEKIKREMGTSFAEMDDNAKKQKYREEMQPFLKKIRFLAMNKVELINNIFKLHLLTKEEEKSIVICMETQNFSDYPSYFSKDSNKRYRNEYSNYASLFDFKYIKESPRVTEKSKKPFTFFSSEILVKEDCFVNTLNLPITLKCECIPIEIYGYINSVQNGVLRFKSLCNSKGNVKLENPIYVGKNSSCRLSVVFEREDWIHNNIELQLPTTDIFCTPEGSEGVLFEQKLIKNGIIEKESDNFAFLVYLYF